MQPMTAARTATAADRRQRRRRDIRAEKAVSVQRWPTWAAAGGRDAFLYAHRSGANCVQRGGPIGWCETRLCALLLDGGERDGREMQIQFCAATQQLDDADIAQLVGVDACQAERLMLRVLAVFLGDVPIAAAGEIVQVCDGLVALSVGCVGLGLAAMLWRSRTGGAAAAAQVALARPGRGLVAVAPPGAPKSGVQSLTLKRRHLATLIRM